ncbi:hypothetical protein Hanom_Chr04g00328091 [Helianthus anomalus]
MKPSSISTTVTKATISDHHHHHDTNRKTPKKKNTRNQNRNRVSSLSPSNPSLFPCHSQICTSPLEPWWCGTAGNEGGA